MNLETINCEYIKVSPFAYEQGWNTETLKEIIITGIYNEGTPISKNISLVTEINTWRVNLVYTSLMLISEMNIKNIFTNQIYNLIDTPLAATSGNMTTIAAAVQVILETTFGLTSITVVANYTTTTTGYFTVTGLPYNLVMDSTVLTLVGVKKTTPFTFVLNADVIINQDCIYLCPSFFEQVVLQDGIYNITTDVIMTDNTDIREQVCLFVDCTLSELLYQNVNIANCDPHDMNLLMIHYALTQASGKACNCSELYKLYDYLANSTTTEDCGC